MEQCDCISTSVYQNYRDMSIAIEGEVFRPHSHIMRLSECTYWLVGLPLPAQASNVAVHWYVCVPSMPLTVVPIVFFMSDNSLVSAIMDVEHPLSMRQVSVVALLAPSEDAAMAILMSLFMSTNETR